MPPGAGVSFLFLDFNTLEDFFGASGAARAANAEPVRVRLKELGEFIRAGKFVALAAVDVHTPDDPEFAQYGLPPHALDRTPGRNKIFETYDRSAQVIPASGQRRPWPNMNNLRQLGGQLILEKSKLDLFSNPAFREVLRSFQPREIVGFGAFMELDIFHTACAARTLGLPLTLIEDACGHRDAAAAEQARTGMLARGVHFETTKEILSRLARETRKAAALQPPADPKKPVRT